MWVSHQTFVYILSSSIDGSDCCLCCCWTRFPCLSLYILGVQWCHVNSSCWFFTCSASSLSRSTAASCSDLFSSESWAERLRRTRAPFRLTPVCRAKLLLCWRRRKGRLRVHEQRKEREEKNKLSNRYERECGVPLAAASSSSFSDRQKTEV